MSQVNENGDPISTENEAASTGEQGTPALSVQDAGAEATVPTREENSGVGSAPSVENAGAPVVEETIPAMKDESEKATAGLASEGAKQPEIPPVQATKSVQVDSIPVEFTESLSFEHAGQYYTKRVGDKMKVSANLFEILYKRGCIKQSF